MRNRFAIVHVSLAILKSLLRLSDSVKLSRVRQSWEGERNGTFELLIEDESLPELGEGQAIPWADIIIHSVYCDSCGRQIDQTEVKI